MTAKNNGAGERGKSNTFEAKPYIIKYSYDDELDSLMELSPS
jgi:hypothetical protein